MRNDFYIYRHIRLDTNMPFNVGKGCGKRAYVKSNRNKYWRNIVDKHGYRVEIILSNLTEKQAFEKEIEFTRLYKNLGYCEANLTDGGGGISGYKYEGEMLEKQRKQVRFHMNREDVRAKMSKIKKAQFKNNPEMIDRARQVKLNSIANNPDQVVQQRKSLIQYYKNENNRNKSSKEHGGLEFVVKNKKTEEIVWEGFSQKLCADILNIYQSNINKCLKGVRKSSGGYIFRYV